MKINSLGFLLHEGWLNIRRHLWMSVAALATVAVTLMVLGGTTWTAYRIHEIVAQEPEQFNVIDVFMKPGATRADTLAAKAGISANPLVRSVTLTTKEQAWADLGNTEPTLTRSLQANPLMDRLQVEARSSDKVAELAHWLRTQKQYPQIMHVNDAEYEVRVLMGFAAIVRNIGMFIALALAAATLLIVYNTIRLTVYSRRREIQIMKLVGATSWFIRCPLIFEGLFHGICGSIVASVALVVAAAQVSRFTATLHSPLIGQAPALVGPLQVFGFLGLTGALVGLAGSILAIHRFVRL